MSKKNKTETSDQPLMATEEIEAVCDKCFEAFTSRSIVMAGKTIVQGRYCQRCVDERSEGSHPEGRKSPLQRWLDICPPSYAGTNLEKLAKLNRLKPVSKIMACSTKGNRMVETCSDLIAWFMDRRWDFRGCGLIGKTRIGKTRLMFAWLGKQYVKHGKTIVYQFAPEFSDIYAALMSESAAKGNAYIERCISADGWFLDDLGKGRLSEPAQRALLRIIESRTAQLRPIFLTANETGDALIKKMAYPDTGEPSEYALPMIERLREFVDFYTF